MSLSPALAEDAPYTYSPEHCEFTVTFPGEPQIERKCGNDDGTGCYDLVTYTQVFEMSTTVKFTAICNPADEEIFNHYTGKVMQSTLKAMVADTVVKTFDTSFREEEHFKQAGLVGEGKMGKFPTIYIGQLWSGRRSIFSIESELLGDAHEPADTLFSEVLRSVRYKNGRPEEAQEEPAEDIPSEYPPGLLTDSPKD